MATAEPRASASAALAALLLRVALGLILVVTSLGRIGGGNRWTMAWLGDGPLAAAVDWLLLALGGLLVAGLFTYGAALAAAATLLVVHAVALETAAAKLYMWSNLLFAGAFSTLLWLAREDRLAAGRWLSRGRPRERTARAHHGPDRTADRLGDARLLLRLALGCDFLAAGWSKLSHPWVAGAAAQFRGGPLPEAVTQATAAALPWLQLLLGAALAAGLFARAAAAALGALMLVLVAGQLLLGASLFSLASMFIYLLVIAAVLCLPGPDRGSLDRALSRVRAWRGSRQLELRPSPPER